jgi:hypothetical protein
VLDYGFDEGGRGDTLLISLQIGNTASVRRLQRQWQSVLKRFGLGFFHSKDYDKEAGQGVFGSIGRAERRRLLGQLTRLVHKHLLFGLTANLDTAMYESETTARFRSDYGSAFSFAVQMALFAANRYLDLEARPINILIARGTSKSKSGTGTIRGHTTKDPCAQHQDL